MNSYTAVIAIDYDEGNQASYRGVTAHITDDASKTDETIEYRTNDPVADLKAACEEAQALPGIAYIGCSSTVDSFVMDGSRYRFTADGLYEEVIALDDLYEEAPTE